MALSTISICAGVAGIDIGLRIACRDARTILFVEREVAACEILAARIADGSLDDAPVWSDLATFDGKPWRGRVDCIVAGLPCQPYSGAGKRKGHDDERAIWPEFIRVVGEVRPSIVFLENVPEFLYYFRPVGEELRKLGFRVEEPVFITAAECGASHKRERLFILAHDSRSRSWRIPEPDGRHHTTNLNRRGASMADAEGRGAPAIQQRRQLRSAEFESASLADTSDTRLEGRGSISRDDAGQCSTTERDRAALADPGSGQLQEPRELAFDTGAQSEPRSPSLFPPGPGAIEQWRDILRDYPELAPAITEAETESVFCRVADGTSVRVDFSRTDRLRALGNAVVPLQAAVAFTVLAKRAGLTP